MLRVFRLLLVIAFVSSSLAHPLSAEKHGLAPRIEGPLHDLDQVTGETRIEALDDSRIAVAVDRKSALASNDVGVEYYAVFTSRAPVEHAPSFWGQATVDFRENLLLVAPEGSTRLYAFVVDREDVPTLEDVEKEFPRAELQALTGGLGLMYRNAPEGMSLDQLEPLAHETSAPTLDFFLRQTEGDGGSGGCATECSMSCIGGDECSITCGSGACASCSCDGGRLECKCS